MIACGAWNHADSAGTPCPDCRWRFVDARALARHRRREHGGQR
jgi:hypothetical protein